MTDGQLVRLTVTGETSAYEELVRRWSARTLAVCHARVRRADLAEEMAQEALFRGYRAIGTLADPEKFGSWLLGIATRVCLDYLKSLARKTVAFSAMDREKGGGDAFAAESAGPAEALEQREELGELMKQIHRLPEKHREVLMLYYYEEHTYQELAEMLGTSAATVNARLTQARQMLRERMTLSDEPVRQPAQGTAPGGKLL